jgi:hypothetical protein
MTRFLSLLLAIGGPTHAAETAPPFHLQAVDEGFVPPEIVRAVQASINLPLAQRMEAISTPLLGRPYVIDGHGEGQGIDPDPPARYDAFDCVTFLEEVLALALAPDPISAPALRQALRYKDGVPGFSRRNHFWLQQWIPNNIDAGLLKDITADLGESHVITKTVTTATWRGWAGTQGFDLSDEALPSGRFSLTVLSLDAAEAAADAIPPGAIIVTVRRPKPWKPIVVSHVGFVLPPRNGKAMIRHSTKMAGGGVKDHGLKWYIDHMRWYDKRPVEGISVLMPREQGPRNSRLLQSTPE